jgi:hypothetical protein
MPENHHELQYPFRCFELSISQANWVEREVEALADRYDLFPARPAWTRIIRTFISHCSPQNPTEGALGDLCHFLYMTLFFNEGRSHRLDAELVSAYWQTLRGEPSAASPHPILRAARDFLPRLSALLRDSASDPAPFYHYLGLNLASFLRDATRSGDAPPDVEDALAVRLHSISALAYFQFWKLLLRVPALDELRCATDIFRCEVLSAKVQGLANDLCSLESDAVDGSPNLLMVLARQRNIAPEEAARTVREWHDHTLREFVEAIACAHGREPPDSVKNYLEFIRSCTAGNFASMRALSSRYA